MAKMDNMKRALKLSGAFIVLFIVPGISKASVYDYPPPKYVVDHVRVSYWHPVDRFLDPGYLRTLRVRCTTRNRKNYNCRFTMIEKNGTTLYLDFKGTVYRSAHSTHLDNWLNGWVYLNSSRSIKMRNISLLYP